MTDQPADAPRISPHPDGDGVILHLPEITYLDTQTWAVDIGLTPAGLAGLRALFDGGAARTASGQQPCVCDDRPEECDAVGQPDSTTADDPTPLRWGLNDVLYGDDDTTIVCFSGPDREPYWLELDAERAAALRDDLAGPAVGQPAEAQPADEARPLVTSWTVCRRGDTDWLVASSDYTDRDWALERLAKRRKEQPDAEFALVRETTTWTVEDETR